MPPNYEDPHDPVWDDPDMESHSDESLIRLGQDTYGPSDLTYNDAIERGARAMSERGYERAPELEGPVNDGADERQYMFMKRQPIATADDDRVVYETADLVRIGREARPDLPLETPELLFAEHGVRELSRRGWRPDSSRGRSTAVIGGVQLWAFCRRRAR